MSQIGQQLLLRAQKVSLSVLISDKSVIKIKLLPGKKEREAQWRSGASPEYSVINKLCTLRFCNSCSCQRGTEAAIVSVTQI